MTRTKLAILAGTALSSGLASANAAPVTASPSWTGFYVGGNVGYSWGTADATINVAPFLLAPATAYLTRLRPDGFVGGFHAGYNHHFSPHWLAGIEVDWQWSGQKDTKRGTASGIITGCYLVVCSFVNTADITAKLSWFGTARGRVGVVSNYVAFYGTGGLAYGSVSVSGINSLSLNDGTSTTTYTTPFSYSKTKAGWVLGAGIEGIVTGSNWTWKVEYLHIDLGSIGGGSFGTGPVVSVNTTRVTDEILRFGISYRFGHHP